jgi:release factor glutamine methyltransferase
VRWSQSDLLDGGSYDAVVANVPYVPEGEVLAPEIVDYEPALAVFAEDDGLGVLRRLVVEAGRRNEVRLVALEVGAGQADSVSGLLAGAGFAEVTRRRDLAGIERVVVGRR